MKRIYYIDYSPMYGGSDFELSNYFINSSHNTYIMNHQIKGNASECGYILHLNMKKGGCFEIDPVSIKGDDVAVSHAFVDGNTMNIVSLRDILRVTKSWLENPINKTEGPIILSFDNKTVSKESEHRVVWKVLFEELYDESKYKDKSWYYPLEKKVVDGTIKLSNLAGKILIKWDQCFAVDIKNGTCFRSKLLNKIDGLSEFKTDKNRADEDENIEIGNYESGKGLLPPTWWSEKEYFDVKITEGLTEFIPKKDKRWVHFAKTNYPLTKTIVPTEVMGEMMSLSWNNNRFSSFNKNILINTINNFIRVFPPGTNVGSGNYNPVKAWNNGCQLVALNLQKQDRFYFINEEFFRDGPYRLKPEWLLTREPKEEDYLDNKEIEITIENLRFKNDKTKKEYYKRIELYGPGDEYKDKVKPSSLKDESVSFKVNKMCKTAPIIYLSAEYDIQKANDLPDRTTTKKKINKRQFRIAKELPYNKEETTLKDIKLIYFERDDYADNTLEKEYPRCFPKAILNKEFEKEKIDKDEKYLSMVYRNDKKFVEIDIKYKWLQ